MSRKRSNKPKTKSTRPAKQLAIDPPAAGWDPEKWLHRCAWCSGILPEEKDALAIRVRLHPQAFKEFDPGTIQPLYLNPIGRVVPMVVLKPDELAKLEGKDALFKLCSRPCAEALLKVLKEELS